MLILILKMNSKNNDMQTELSKWYKWKKDFSSLTYLNFYSLSKQTPR